jgi:hypothetical protein
VLPKMADHWLADEYTPQRTPYVEHEFTRSCVGNIRARAGMLASDRGKSHHCQGQYINSDFTCHKMYYVQ